MARLDPISVPYRVGTSLVRLIWIVAVVSISSSQVAPDLGAVLVAVAVVGVGLAALAYQTAYYRRFEYELTAESFDIRSGVLSRTRREIPLSRVQNVDISRDVLQRALGIAEVRLETAGGSESEARLRFVDAAEARRLQEELGRLKAGTSTPGSEDDPGAAAPGAGPRGDPERLFAIANHELALLGLVSVDLRLVPLLSVALPVIAPRLADAPVIGPGNPTVNPFLLAPLSAVGFYLLLAAFSGVVAVTNYYGFRLWRVGEELRYERGLFQRYSGTIPVEKIQRLSVKANALARAIDYASLTVETAGYAPGESRGSQSAVPFARRDRVHSLARSIEAFGDPKFQRPPERARRRYLVRYALVVAGAVVAVYGVDRFTGVTLFWQATAVLFAAVPVGAHLTWRSRGYALTDGYGLVRSGWLVRRVHVVPDYRVQTIVVTASPFQRRRDLATLIVDTAGEGGFGGQQAAAIDIDSDRAEQLRTEIERRLQDAMAARREHRRVERLRALGVDPDAGTGDGGGGPPSPAADGGTLEERGGGIDG